MREVVAKDGGVFPVYAPDISGWATILHHPDPQGGHRYAAYAGDDYDAPIGRLVYIADFPEPGVISVGELAVDPAYRNRGVARALIVRLHTDNPGYKISPHHPPEAGLPFLRHLLDTEPTVRAYVHLLPEVQAAL